MDFGGKRVAILGLGIEGKDALKFLIEQGAEVTVFDQKEKSELALPLPTANHLSLITGPDYLKGGLAGFDFIVRSPGVRPDLPQIKEAVNKGAILTSATNIFFELCPSLIIGVTGTKGKGTTATLIYESLKASGRTSYLAGNIGKPYLELLPQLTRSDLVVLELSSFQLIDIVKSPHIAVVLNITTDHLDWHKDRKEYVVAKKNIVKFQKKGDYAVLMQDYKTPASFAEETKARVFWASINEEVKGGYVLDDKIFLNIDKRAEIGPVDKLLLGGRHNWENVVCAAVASYLTGATISGIKSAFFSFKGLPHRLELVGTYRGITFYNDSIATSPQPVLAAVDAFSEPLILILGGSSKGLSYKGMANQLVHRNHIKAVLVIGQVGQKIQKELKNARFSGKIINGGKSMKEIVGKAVELARAGDVILLSPAAASFDMFRDYKDRGEQFREEVGKL